MRVTHDEKGGCINVNLQQFSCILCFRISMGLYKYLLLTEFEVRTVSYGPSFFFFDLWPKRAARGP